MMNNPYDLHSRSKEYRDERLREASRTHLEVGLRADRWARSGRIRAGLAWGGVLSLLCGAGFSE